VGDFWSKAIAEEGSPDQLADDLLTLLLPLLEN